MKRKILFKAKRFSGKGWIEGQLTTQDGRCFITDDCIIDVVNFNSSTEFEYECEVLPETVCFNLYEDLYTYDIVMYKGKDYFIQDGGFYYYLERNMVRHGENEMITLDEDVIYEMIITGKNIHDK